MSFAMVSYMHLNNTAAEVLARAVQAYFPHARFLKAGVDRLGFFTDFAIETPFEQVFLPRIMDAMKQLLKSTGPFRELQMSAHHARRYLQKTGFPGSEKVAGSSVLSLFEWAGIASVSEGPFCSDPEELCHFALLDATHEGNSVRIHGAAFEGARQQSDFLKKWRTQSQKGHLALGSKSGLISPLSGGRFLWHPKGVAKLKALETFWHNQVEEGGFALFSGALGKEALNILGSPLATIKEISFPKEVGPYLGLFASEKGLSDRLHIKSSKEGLKQNCISLLKFIEKFHTLLGFEYQWVMSLPRAGGSFPKALVAMQRDALSAAIDSKSFTEAIGKKASLTGFVPDRLGRLWEGPSLSLEIAGEEIFIEGSVFGRLDWTVALLLEANLIEMRQVNS